MKQVRLDEEIETLRRKVVVLTLGIPTARALEKVMTLAGELPNGVTNNDTDVLKGLARELGTVIASYDRSVQSRAVGE